LAVGFKIGTAAMGDVGAQEFTGNIGVDGCHTGALGFGVKTNGFAVTRSLDFSISLVFFFQCFL